MSIVLLEKDDFIVLPNGQLRIRHPAFQGRGGYAAFYAYHCPQCQDTKTSWSAIGLVNGHVNVPTPQENPWMRNEMVSRSRCIKRYPLLRRVRPDGVVGAYNGPDTKAIVNEMCIKAGLQCGQIHRCFDNQRYYQW